MLNIKEFGLANFRIFKDFKNFELRPITILTGANNSGKSTLIKALLLLRDSNRIGHLFGEGLIFRGGEHNLGTINNVINNQSKDSTLTFSFLIPYPDLSVEGFSYKVEHFNTRQLATENDFRIDGKQKPCEDLRVNLKVCSLSKENNDAILEQISIYDASSNNLIFEYRLNKQAKKYYSYLNPSFIIDFISGIRSVHYFDHLGIKGPKSFRPNGLLAIYSPSPITEDEVSCLQNIEMKIIRDNFTQREGPGIEEKYIQAYRLLYFDEFLQYFWHLIDEELIRHSLDYKVINIDKEYYFFATYTIRLLDQIFNTLENISFEYLPSMRGNINRLYTYTSQGIPLNQILVDYYNKSISERKPDKEWINKWLKEFKIGDSFEITSTEGVINAPYVTRKGKKYLLADMGYGYTQMLPIILSIGMEDTSALIIEEPEANLHPKYQSKLADLFAESLVNNQFIIETHSEYFIRKIQYLTAIEKIKKEDVIIYYFNEPDENDRPENEQQIKRIEILENGKLSDDFGPGFFDEADNLAIDLFNFFKHQLN